MPLETTGQCVCGLQGCPSGMLRLCPPRLCSTPSKSCTTYRNPGHTGHRNTGHQTAHRDLMFHLKWSSVCFAGTPISPCYMSGHWKNGEYSDYQHQSMAGELFSASWGSGMRRPQDRLAGIACNHDDHSGSHDSLHVQDLQGLRDLGAGVNLAIHAHQEGSMQQHSRMLLAE